VIIHVGTSATIPVRLFSEGPVPDWTVDATDEPQTNPRPASPNLTFSWDRTTGNNGDVLALTIHVNAVDPTYNGNIFSVRSYDGVLYHTFWGYIGQE
jgi:hypothetical protein